MVVNPADFQTQATAWIAAITTVVVLAVGAVVKILAMVSANQKDIAAGAADIKNLFHTANAHGEDIRSLNEQTTTLAVAIPAPGQTVTPTTTGG